MHPTLLAAELADEMAEIIRRGVPLVAVRQPAVVADELVAVAAALRHGQGAAEGRGDDSGSLEKLPTPLRGILSATLAGTDGRLLLAALQRYVESRRADRRLFRSAIAYPVAVTLLACVGIVWLWTNEVPPVDQLGTSFVPLVPNAPQTTAAVRWLWWPAACGIALGIAVAVVARSLVRQRWQSADATDALVCTVRAALTKADRSSADEARMLAEICGGDGATHNETPSSARPLAMQAATFAESKERAEAFQAVAAFYEAADEANRCERGRLLPIMGAFVAGFVVFLYAVALFGPLTESMQRMADSKPGLTRRSDVP